MDDALALVRRWEQRGITRFRTIAYDLFLFGARVYAGYQPEFLDEFVSDNTDPRSSSPDYVQMCSAAGRALGLRGATDR